MLKRIQLGSGDRYEDGWINVDLYAARADLRVDLRSAEFPSASAQHVRVVHTIEHFNRDDALAILQRIHRWLAIGGILEIETPDRKKCMNLIFYEAAYLLGAKGLLGGRSVDKPGWHAWLETWATTEGLEEYIKEHNVGDVAIPPKWNVPGEQHLYVWSGEQMATELLRLGFASVKVGNPKHHGGRAWRDTRVVATK